MNKEFLHNKDGRAIRILAEFLEPEYRFRQFGIDDTIVFFGSARILPKRVAAANLRKLRKDPKSPVAAVRKAVHNLEMSRYYEEAVELSRRLSEWNKSQKNQYAICSGGGPGIMEASNKGAHLAHAPSIGLNIHLPFEQHANPYISSHLNFEFHYFFVRKFWFVYMAKAIIMFPGGFGTLDEMMEVLTLVQTERITKKMVVVLYGAEFWSKVLNLDYLVETGMISPEDLNLFKICATVEEAFEYVTKGLRVNSDADSKKKKSADAKKKTSKKG
ncbi:MAG: putative Rossmann fold nucleotide-binding protein [Fibrobacteres bacterium]|nr:putative Rossmann fold nucleotide-binding protein [Fibrobacterota bacterium]